jgi:hypothetical protein
VVNVHALLATGVNGDGYREILGLQVMAAVNHAAVIAKLRLGSRSGSSHQLVDKDRRRAQRRISIWPFDCSEAMIAVDLHAFAETLLLHDTGLTRAGSGRRAWCLTIDA